MEVTELSEESAYSDYSASVHGRGLTEKGLLPSAICIDCHSSHMILKHDDERSTVNETNLPATFGNPNFFAKVSLPIGIGLNYA